MPDTYLIDKSALVRMPESPDVDTWTNRVDRGLVRIAVPTLLELGYSARSADDLTELLDEPPVAAMPVEHLTPAAEKRALDVLRLLAAQGQHRAPSVADVLLAAIAEQSNLVVLHVDKDFDLIASVTGQKVQRLALSPL
ncbi:MAG: PIN domain nuclease [Micrococcales bacterium]|nr:PIN domain nuclease [Micrococcales bacterium]